jgi:hypothetical protein
MFWLYRILSSKSCFLRILEALLHCILPSNVDNEKCANMELPIVSLWTIGSLILGLPKFHKDASRYSALCTFNIKVCLFSIWGNFFFGYFIIYSLLFFCLTFVFLSGMLIYQMFDLPGEPFHIFFQLFQIIFYFNRNILISRNSSLILVCFYFKDALSSQIFPEE